VLCHRCGARNPDDVNFCSACGESQHRDASEDTLSIPAIDEVEVEGEESLESMSVDDVLLVNSGPSSGARFVIEDSDVTVGRKSSSVIFLDDVTVSREHARFFRTDSRRVGVKDLGSLNGTYVNRVRVDEKLLNSGDEIQIGKFKLVFIAKRDR
jgi:pSer/pThr/pTyr-binding forkhead associated (FHA) protein